MVVDQEQYIKEDKVQDKCLKRRKVPNFKELYFKVSCFYQMEECSSWITNSTSKQSKIQSLSIYSTPQQTLKITLKMKKANEAKKKKPDKEKVIIKRSHKPLKGKRPKMKTTMAFQMTKVADQSLNNDMEKWRRKKRKK